MGIGVNKGLIQSIKSTADSSQNTTSNGSSDRHDSDNTSSYNGSRRSPTGTLSGLAEEYQENDSVEEKIEQNGEKKEQNNIESISGGSSGGDGTGKNGKHRRLESSMKDHKLVGLETKVAECKNQVAISEAAVKSFEYNMTKDLEHYCRQIRKILSK